MLTHDNYQETNRDTLESQSESESEPHSWRCECCRKDFKSEKQFDNHIKSKKHKEMSKKNLNPDNAINQQSAGAG